MYIRTLLCTWTVYIETIKFIYPVQLLNAVFLEICRGAHGSIPDLWWETLLPRTQLCYGFGRSTSLLWPGLCPETSLICLREAQTEQTPSACLTSRGAARFRSFVLGYRRREGPAGGFVVSTSVWSQMKLTLLDTPRVPFSPCVWNITMRNC